MFKKSRRGAELSLTIIIIAIILLIVLIVMVAIFTGKISMFGKATATCSSKGGQCSDQLTGGLTCPGGYATFPGATDCQNACCIPIE